MSQVKGDVDDSGSLREYGCLYVIMGVFVSVCATLCQSVCLCVNLGVCLNLGAFV